MIAASYDSYFGFFISSMPTLMQLGVYKALTNTVIVSDLKGVKLPNFRQPFCCLHQSKMTIIND